MKTIKTKLTTNGANLYFKALVAGTAAGGLTAIILFCLISILLLMSGSLPLDFLLWFGLAIGMVSSFIGGYTCSRITKINGMIIGTCCGFVIFMILFFSGIINGKSISLIALIKLILYSICGAIGGIKGVNKKEKLHIK